MKLFFNKKFLLFVATLLTLISISVRAHIKNESSQFPDIEFSDSQFEIVLLVGAGILPETPVFEPDLSLSRDSLDGDATYIDINNLLFQGQLIPEMPEAVPTKGEAAQFIAMNLTIGVDGKTLLDKKGMRVGPVGEVTAIESRMNPDGGSSYYITVAGETYPLYSHGRVANGPTDLIQWKNRIIKRSFLKDLGDFTLWVYLEAEPIQSVVTSVNAASNTMNNTAESDVEIATNHNLLYGLTAAVLLLGFILFFKSKRS
jgi:hypothetical protein